MFKLIAQYRIFSGIGGGVMMMSAALILSGVIFHITLLIRRVDE
ncbi:MAG: hypothetical protein ABIR10_08730 [Dokdonella sp.]